MSIVNANPNKSGVCLSIHQEKGMGWANQRIMTGLANFRGENWSRNGFICKLIDLVDSQPLH